MKKLNALAREGKINENAGIRDSHSIIINADIDRVWNIIADMESWPEWNPEVKKVNVEGELSEGTYFSWTQGRTSGKSQIQAVKKPALLSWTSKARFVNRIYVWTFESDESQTIATVSASFQGTFVVIVENHQKVYHELLNWLELLKNKAEGEE